MSLLKTYVLKHKYYFILFTLVSMLGALSVVATAYIIQLLAETVTGNSVDQLWFVAIITLVYLVIDSYMDYIVDVVNQKLSQAVMKDIRRDMVERIEKDTIESLEKNGVGYYLNMYSTDLEIIERDYLKELLSMYNDVWTLIFGLVSTIILHPLFSMIMLLLGSVPMLIPYITKRYLRHSKLGVSDAGEAYVHKFEELLRGFATIKLFRGFAGYNQRLEEKSEALAAANNYSTHVNKTIYAISYGMRAFVNLFAWIVGGYFVITGNITLVMFFTIKQLVAYVTYPIQGFGSSYTEVIAAKSVVNKVLDFIHSAPISPVYEKENVQRVVLDKVSMERDNHVVFADVSLCLEKGKKYLVIGESGSGKTTLIKILLG